MLGCRMALSCHWHFKGCVIVGQVRWEGLERHGWGMAGGEVMGGEHTRMTSHDSHFGGDLGTPSLMGSGGGRPC